MITTKTGISSNNLVDTNAPYVWMLLGSFWSKVAPDPVIGDDVVENGKT